MDVGHYAHALDMLLNLSLSAPLAQRLSKAAHATENPSDLAKITWLIMRQNQALSLDVSNSKLHALNTLNHCIPFLKTRFWSIQADFQAPLQTYRPRDLKGRYIGKHTTYQTEGLGGTQKL